ncbi:MAG: LysR family transcriptional regulator [Variovorax sp.]
MSVLPSIQSISARLRFKQLAFLIALGEAGSLHRAAEQLGMTQPGASKMLHEVEATFGTALFVRSPRGMVANELGRCVLRYAKLSHSDLGHLREEISGVLSGKGGRLAVGAIGGALPAVVVRALTRLRRAQPALSVSVKEDTSAGLLAALDDGRLDLAIGRTTVALEPERYAFEPLLEEQVAVAVGPRHPWAHARRVTLQQLSQAGWVLYPSPMPLRSLLEREMKEAGLPFPEHATETSSIFVTLLLLQEEVNVVALLSSETMAFYGRCGMARELPIKIRSRTEPYGIVTRQGAALSPIAALMVDSLKTEARGLSA